VILAYPALATEEGRTLGSLTTFERVDVKGVSIYAVVVEVRGISRRGGLAAFRLRAHQQPAAGGCVALTASHPFPASTLTAIVSGTNQAHQER